MDRFVIPSSFGCQAGHQLRRSRSLGGRDVPERGQHLLPGLGVAGVNQHGQDDQPRHRHGGVIVSGSWSVRPGSWPSPRSVPRRDQRAGACRAGSRCCASPRPRACGSETARCRSPTARRSNAQPRSQQPAPWPAARRAVQRTFQPDTLQREFTDNVAAAVAPASGRLL